MDFSAFDTIIDQYKNYDAIITALLGLLIITLLLLIRWQWKANKKRSEPKPEEAKLKAKSLESVPEETKTELQVVHKICPHNNVVLGIPLKKRDSFDEHLDLLTRKLADKESHLRLSKTKIMQAKHEMQSLHSIDMKMKEAYYELMDDLRRELKNSQNECKRLQDQIEWVSCKRAEITDEIQRSQLITGEAAFELAFNLTELQRGRMDHKIVDKPQRPEGMGSLRHRKVPLMTKAGLDPLIIKDSEPSSPSPLSTYGLSTILTI